MATIEEMYRIWSLKPDHAKICLRDALKYAENDGRCYIEEHDICRCIYWRVADYIIIYLTDDEDFEVDMLTDDEMYDLIIEEV